MKTLFTKLFFISTAVMLLGSCKKDEVKQYFEGGTAPVLTASVSGTIPLAYANKTQTGVIFSWTNPAYQFVNGISSQDVSYTLQIDVSGKNFSSPAMQSFSISKDLGITYTQDQFNLIVATNMKLPIGVQSSVDVRIMSSINGVAATLLSSNTLTFAVTPYSPPPKVTPPSTGQLFIVGSATAGGWTNPVPVPSQQFTQVSTTLYTITVALTGGQEYLFLPKNGDWSNKYAVPDKTVPGLSSGGSFLPYSSGGDNIPGPAVSGTYKIVVDFQQGIFTVTKQ